jgi:hypothetical protein
MGECLFKIFQAGSDTLLLVELGSINVYTSEQKAVLPQLLPHLANVQSVISLSSGCSNFTGSSGDFGRTLSSMLRGCAEKIHFVPFTDKEFTIMSKLYPRQYPLPIATYKHLTQFNPLLLVNIAGSDELHAVCEVEKQVKNLIADIIKSLSKEAFVYWIKKSIPESINMLIYAANGMMISKSTSYLQYYGTWLHAENITYVCKESTDEFMLAINFPTCFNHLLQILYDRRAQADVSIRSAIIDELYFERDICTTIKQLDVLYSQKDEAVASQSDLKTIVFKFKSYVSNQVSNSPVKCLPEGVLYFLRSFHPVIDAVAHVRVGNTPWLVLIQVSLSDYRNHESKINDLKKEITGCEKYRVSEEINWLDYYRNQVPEVGREGLMCVYVYVSPKDFIEPDATTNLVSYNLRRKEEHNDDAFFGLILKDSESATFITAAKEKVMLR